MVNHYGEGDELLYVYYIYLNSFCPLSQWEEWTFDSKDGNWTYLWCFLVAQPIPLWCILMWFKYVTWFLFNFLFFAFFFRLPDFFCSYIKHYCPAIYVDCILWDAFCRYHLEDYTSDYTAQVLLGYCMVYIFMQTFMIPGTVFMSLLAGALFGVFRGVSLVVFNATAGASSCYFLSKLIGRPLVFSLWPDKLSFFQAQVNLNSSSK